MYSAPEIQITEVQPQNAVSTQPPAPESSVQQPQNATPLNSTPISAGTGQGSEPREETTTPEPRGEDGAAAQPDQQKPQPTTDGAEEPAQPPQTEESEVNEDQEDEDQEKQAQLATQVNLLLTQALAVVNKGNLSADQKNHFREEITNLQQEILEKRGGITYPDLGARLTEIGGTINLPQLQILGLELQRLFAEGEEKESLQQQIEKLAGDNETFKNQLPRLYQLFTGKKFDEKNPQLIDIAKGFVEALDNIDEVAKRTEQLGFNPEKIKEALSVSKEQKQLIEQAVNKAKKEKKFYWQTAGALGILGILILLFTLIRSALTGEREQSPI